MQHERNTMELREQEMETFQSKHSEEVSRLGEQARKADISRRELEGQLLPMEQRVQDMEEEISRGREKERLRKEYIDELKVARARACTP